MKLEEILGLIYGDQTYINLFSESAEHLLESYDGRNSLTDTYNKCEVCQLELAYGGRAINIYLEDRDCLPLWERKKLTDKANERDRIIWGEDFDENEYSGGIRHFTHISVDTAQLLIDRGYLDPEDQQNFSPTAREIINFIRCSTNPYDWWLSGYAVSPARDDFRVTIDSFGIKEGARLDTEDAVAFVRFARYADEFCFDMEGSKAIVAEAWWD